MSLREIETTATHYRLERDGQPLTLPRVTSILGIVRQDLAPIPADVLVRAAERGKAVHRAVYLLAGGVDRQGKASGLAWDTLHPELVPYVRAYQDAQKALGFRVIATEQLVASTTFGYAGRADLIVRFRGRIPSNDQTGILDIKSGEEHAAHRLQVSAYLEGFKETTGSRKRLHRWILYLRASGTYRLDDCTTGATHEQDFRTFTNILGAYRWLQAQQGNGRNGP